MDAHEVGAAPHTREQRISRHRLLLAGAVDKSPQGLYRGGGETGRNKYQGRGDKSTVVSASRAMFRFLLEGSAPEDR